jgi:hypothetical protein
MMGDYGHGLRAAVYQAWWIRQELLRAHRELIQRYLIREKDGRIWPAAPDPTGKIT